MAIWLGGSKDSKISLVQYCIYMPLLRQKNQCCFPYESRDFRFEIAVIVRLGNEGEGGLIVKLHFLPWKRKAKKLQALIYRSWWWRRWHNLRLCISTVHTQILVLLASSELTLFDFKKKTKIKTYSLLRNCGARRSKKAFRPSCDSWDM